MPDIWMDSDVALSEVPVNIMPLIDDTDFKTRETAITYNQAGMDLVWNFVVSAGTASQTAVTPTTGGSYDWTNQGDGMYTIEIPASGGSSINNDTEGYGWFTGYCTGVLPWRGPIIGFRAAALNDALIDGGDLLDVNATQWAGGSTATTNIAVKAILTKTTDISGFNDLSAANVNTEVDAALDEAGTELVSIPSTTGSLRQKINFIFQYFRNRKTVTATTETLFKEDAATSLGTATVSDDGTTFTKEEAS
ncbi:MAG: hypothetical protein AAB922_05385 [Patescibacteria group bacterium]